MTPTKQYDELFKQKVLTASPVELVTIMYEQTIKFVNLATKSLSEKNIECTNTYIQKAQAILTELMCNLDYTYPVADDFYTVYSYIYHLLIQANVSKDATYLSQALTELRDMRDMWKQLNTKC